MLVTATSVPAFWMHGFGAAICRQPPLQASIQHSLDERELSDCTQANNEIHLLYITWTLLYIGFNTSCRSSEKAGKLWSIGLFEL